MNKKILVLLFILNISLIVSSTSLWTNQKSNEENSSIFVHKRIYSIGDVIQLTVSETSNMAFSDDTANYKDPAVGTLNSIFSNIGGISLQTFLPLGSTDPSQLNNIENKPSQAQSQTNVDFFISVKIVDEENELFKVRGEKEIKIGNDRKRMIVQGYLSKKDISPSGIANSINLLNSQIWYDGDIVFQQDPNEPSWTSWILSGISNLFF